MEGKIREFQESELQFQTHKSFIKELMMKDGFYKINYTASILGAMRDTASIENKHGVWIVENGVARGAEGQFLFTGKIKLDDNNTMLAEIAVLIPQHVPFIAAGRHSLFLNGTVSGDSFSLEGEVKISAVRAIWISGEWVAPLTL